jgi:OOP family OmpA-OmpF porin
MNSNFKKAASLITGVLLAGSAFAQTPDSNAVNSNYVKPFSSTSAFRTWSIGVSAGVMTPFTPFRSDNRDFLKASTQLGYGAYVKDQILPSFGIQANFLKGKVEGDNSANGAYSQYVTSIDYAAELSGVFTLANISWQHKNGVIQPYLSAGFGLTAYKPQLSTPGPSASRFSFPAKANGESIKSAYIPVGIGLKINLSPTINLDLGYQVNFMDADNFDGFDFGPSNDKFSYAHAGLEFALGSRSKPQLATHNPVASMRSEYLMDEERLQRQVDAQKAQNDQLRSDLNSTRNDLSAVNANLTKFTIDSDGDGVPDFFDKCPNTPAGTKVDGSGCPLPVAVNKPDVKVYVTEEDKKVVKEAIKNLEFDFGKATIREHSFPSLDRVAQLLIDKNFSLKLAGHTDNVGSVSANLKLSKDRAEAIKNYLVNKGANPSRIEATGYGKEQPIATNKTAAGRQLNRRVEFTLF